MTQRAGKVIAIKMYNRSLCVGCCAWYCLVSVSILVGLFFPLTSKKFLPVHSFFFFI